MTTLNVNLSDIDQAKFNILFEEQKRKYPDETETATKEEYASFLLSCMIYSEYVLYEKRAKKK